MARFSFTHIGVDAKNELTIRPIVTTTSTGKEQPVIVGSGRGDHLLRAVQLRSTTGSAIASPPPDERLVYTVSEAAALLGISRAHGYDLVASGQLPHLRLGRRVVVPKHVLAKLLDIDSVG